MYALQIEESFNKPHDDYDEIDDDAADDFDETDPDQLVHGRDEKEHYLFEEEMEIVWDKGGSGLVFHTDDAYWEAQRGDLDEQWADGFEIDGFQKQDSNNSQTHDPTSTQDHQQQQQPPPRRRHRHADGLVTAQTMMKQMGWSEGQGLGKHLHGRAFPLSSQSRRRRQGLGYCDQATGGDGDSVAVKRPPSSTFFMSAPPSPPEKLVSTFSALIPKAKADGEFTLEDDRILEHLIETQPIASRKEIVDVSPVNFVFGGVL
eukprot:c5333_g1_i1.p1 GENE.c5333_g1_i1~~c5333_g1_i1.p1  ORF type:complete len:276 (+),score=62.03 c5333_g1_i1:49-828(+)